MEISSAELKGFAEGGHLRLRPVQASDLAELARIRAQAPGGRRPVPWTQTRLEKAYNNPDKPGLWEEQNKTYTCTDLEGKVIGVLQESYESWLQAYSINFQLDEKLAGREVLGYELASLYLDYLTRWFDPGLITCEVLDNDAQKCTWLEAAGFERDLHMQRTDLCNGEIVGRYAYAWRSAARSAGPDLSTGEPDYPASGSSQAARSEGSAAGEGS